MAKIRLGLDVGGTFTDLVLIDQSGRSYVCKVPSTPSDPAASSLTAIRAALQHAALEPQELADVEHTHSNTLATNAVIERTGTRTGVLVTRGTRDLFELQRLALQNSNRFDAGRPQPLVPRSLVREVDGRVDHHGRELAPLDLDSVADATAELVELGCSAIAIVFLHSYANPQHELAAQRHIASLVPELPVELSSDVWPQAREYERASLTVINASLRQLVTGYVDALERDTRELGLTRPPMIARSNGGKQHARATAARPVATILSGPAANVAGAAAAAIAEGWKDADLVTVDVGGTSADIGLVRSGSAVLSSDEQIGGIPILIPTVAVSAIGSGGNSIVAIDPNGRLKVGPDSLGSTPGPACYGQQSDTAGLSDAFVLCDWLSESVLLGGNVPLNRDGAESVFAQLAQGVDASPVEVADGAIRIAVAAMASEATRFLARHTTDYSQFWVASAAVVFEPASA